MWHDTIIENKQKPKINLFFDPELSYLLSDESITAWCVRFKQVTGRSPGFSDLLISPFHTTVLPVCRTTEKFVWCVQNFGLDNFLEFINNNSNSEKLWIFKNSIDAVQFKLRWSGDSSDARRN